MNRASLQGRDAVLAARTVFLRSDVQLLVPTTMLSQFTTNLSATELSEHLEWLWLMRRDVATHLLDAVPSFGAEIWTVCHRLKADDTTVCHRLKADDTHSRFWPKSAPTSGLYVIPIWYQIFLVPGSDAGRLHVLFCANFWYMHVTTTATGVKEMFLCTMSWLLITITGINEMDSSIFASSMLIFAADFFVPD